ncbi:MAG: serine/threonine-protein kinase [Planctomycetota bacterium]|nr:serine/threonine-protein kinase [Planctomycetota bacterium]
MTDDASQERSRPDPRSDSFVERTVVDLKLATQAEVNACQAKQKKLRAAGKSARLSDILVKNGFVTASQLDRLMNPSEDSGTRTLQQIPGFQIMQKIGAGAMATVYKAKQLSLDRIVAIKVLPKRLSENPEFVERFYREGRAAAKLNHNNIVQAIDVGENGGYHYFVMEFVDGSTVYDEFIKNRSFDEARALDIIRQVGLALEHAHARGFIHRDVKPKNIIITKDGTAKLADMGLARAAGDEAAAAAEAGRAYGTPYYISPEQVRGQVNVDFRTDVYSLGATLYHMVTGKVPFDGPTPAAVMHKHLKEPLIPPDHVNAKLSTGLAEIIERMMAKDRDKRYAATTDVLIDLEKLQRGEAPLQARSGYADSLLENLADGREDEGEWQPRHSSIAQESSASHWPIVVIALSAVIVVLLIVIGMLALR